MRNKFCLIGDSFHANQESSYIRQCKKKILSAREVKSLCWIYITSSILKTLPIPDTNEQPNNSIK